MNVNAKELRWIPIVAAMAVALLGSGCGDSGNAQPTANAPNTSAAAPINEAAQSAPSAPPAAQTPQTPPQASGDPPSSDQTAQASDDALRPMTKDEETKNMPRPSQANDHSTLSPPKDANR